MLEKIVSQKRPGLLIAAFVLALLASGCSKVKAPSARVQAPTPPAANNGALPPPRGNPPPANSSQDALTGSWTSACVSTAPDEEPNAQSKIVKWTFSDNSVMTENLQYFQDAATYDDAGNQTGGCSTPQSNYTLNGSYVIGDAVSGDIRNLDYMLNNFSSYQIFRTDGYSLWMGDDTGSNNAGSPDTRPTTLFNVPSFNRSAN